MCVCVANTFRTGNWLNFCFSQQFLPVLTLCGHFNVSVTAASQAGRGCAWLDEDSEVEVVYVREPTAEQAALARELLLPLTFFCYQNEPDYTSDDPTDGESNKMRISINSDESEN